MERAGQKHINYLPRLDATHSNVVIFTKGRMPDAFSLLIVCP